MDEKLAIDGGTPVRSNGMPARGLIGEEEKAAAMTVFDEAIASGSAFGYNGTHEEAYEKAFPAFMGGGFADGVNSGTNAVFAALGGLQLDALSEVIVPPMTDPGGVMPVVLLNCVPVLADCAPDSYNTSAEQIAPLINERTKAIIVAHIAGEPVDMDPVLELARKHNLPVIEDCAQAHGARYKGRLVGSLGDIACFSTMFGKHHCTGGQGGVVYSTNEELHWKAKRFADRGKPFNIEADANVVAGLNCNLNELSAALGVVQLKKLPSIIAARRKVGEAIKERLGELTAVSMGWQPTETECVYWFLRIRVDTSLLTVDKASFCAALKAEGMPVTPTYGGTIQCQAPWFKEKAVFGQSGFPWNCSDYKGPRDPQFRIENALAASASCFNIAVNEQYGQREIDDIVAALTKVEKAYLK